MHIPVGFSRLIHSYGKDQTGIFLGGDDQGTNKRGFEVIGLKLDVWIEKVRTFVGTERDKVRKDRCYEEAGELMGTPGQWVGELGR